MEGRIASAQQLDRLLADVLSDASPKAVAPPRHPESAAPPSRTPPDQARRPDRHAPSPLPEPPPPAVPPGPRSWPAKIELRELTSLPLPEFALEAHRLLLAGEPDQAWIDTAVHRLREEALAPSDLVMELAEQGGPSARARIRGYGWRKGLQGLERMGGVGRAVAITRTLVHLPELSRQVRVNELTARQAVARLPEPGGSPEAEASDLGRGLAELEASNARLEAEVAQLRTLAVAARTSKTPEDAESVQAYVEERLADQRWLFMRRGGGLSLPATGFASGGGAVPGASMRRSLTSGPTETYEPPRLRAPASGEVASAPPRQDGPPRFARRSRLDRRREALRRAFGDSALTEPFLAEVFDAARVVAESESPAAPFLDDVLIARWLLTGRSAGRPLGTVQAQWAALYYAGFMCAGERRSAAEMAACNAAAARALTAQVFSTGYDGLPITAFMASAINEHQPTAALETQVGRDRLCAAFFLQDVPRHRLERFVTPDQRAALRAPAGGLDAADPWAVRLSLVQTLLLRSDPKLARRFPTIGAAALPAFLDWYRDIGVWERGLDYTLSEDELAAGRISVKADDEGFALYLPPYLVSVAEPPTLASTAEADAWLNSLVWSQRYDKALPWRMFDASTFDYVLGTLSPGSGSERPERSTKGGRVLNRGLRPGEMLTFGEGGPGIAHLIGRGWASPEAPHVWTVANTSLLAIELAPEDEGPLDLFLDFFVGPLPDTRVTVTWNSRPVELILSSRRETTSVVCALGSRHRTGSDPNILGLAIDRVFVPAEHGSPGDGRTLGLGLRRLSLVRR